MKNTVIHHSADFDGLFCREIARHFLPDDTEFIGWDYGQPLVPMPAVGTLYVLDLNPECVLQPDFARIIWIDHHKSAIDKLPQNLVGYRIDGVAACRLTWQWFVHFFADMLGELPDKAAYIERQVHEPLAVRLAGEYDIWDKRDHRAETFQFGLRSTELGPKQWADLLRTDNQFYASELVGELLETGLLLQRYQRDVDAGVVKRAFEVKFEGLTFLALNTARCNSLTFESAAQPNHDGLMGFYFNGQEWRVSLYHSPHHREHDLSTIAVKYGGGGHRGACGFRADKLPFIP